MMVLMMMEDMLSDLGCESIASAASIDQALALIGSQPFDAATLDVNLNGVMSYPVADALAAHGVPFAFSTGYGGVGLGVGYRDRPVLNKPFHSDELGSVLTRLTQPERPRAAVACAPPEPAR